MTTTHSIGELIAQNVLGSLNNIRRANGYEIDCLARRANKAGMPLSPANDANGATYENEIIIEQGQLKVTQPTEYNKMNLRQMYGLYCYAYIGDTEADRTPIDQRLNQLQASVIKALYADAQRGTHPDTSNPLAIDTEVMDSQPFTDDAGLEGVFIPLEVHYRISQTDPYSH